MTVDLHIHTNASDGILSPGAVVRMALDLDLKVIAITDHDTVEGLDEALGAAEGTSLEVLPGVELSVEGPGGSDPHILGYLIDHRMERLRTALRVLRRGRMERARRMVRLLTDAGHAITIEGVLHHAGSGAVGRSHVAKALVDSGSVSSVEAAFRQLIGRDAPFYVAKSVLSAQDGIRLIHEAGGVAVFAHPAVTGEGALIPLVEAGLDGIEAFHAEHSEAEKSHLVSEAKRLGLIVTGGSDFHGPGLRNATMGSGGCPEDAVGLLRRRATILRP